MTMFDVGMGSWRGWFFSSLVVVLCGRHHASAQTCTKPGKVV